MQKKKTELMQLIGHQCFMDYEENGETIKGLEEIMEYNEVPEILTKYSPFQMSLIHAFLYGTIMGIQHERKKRKEKANRALENTLEIKRRLVDLVKDIPWWADTTCDYLYSFIAFGMLNGKFRMSEGHKKELEIFKAEYDKKQEEKKIETEQPKPELSKKNKLLYSSMNMLTKIEGEDVQEYLNIIIADTYKEVCHE